uniref:aldehyde oxygenase (deformylating) n=1 Tax=Oryza glumipatula TaxID=40148 RepID=A0A0D9ZN31_9ORYZ
MATRPGPLTEWPWQWMGGYKYLVLAPVAMHTAHRLATKGWGDFDPAYTFMLPTLLLRMIHNQIWISLSRYQTARRKHLIVDRSLDFEQVDRERDDQIILNGLLFYLGYAIIPNFRLMPVWRTNGALITILLHMGPVEFLYYWFHRALHHHFLYSRYHSHWFHRALHHHFLYSRYHSHHHASIVTEPITYDAVIHPFAEHLAYFLLFSISILPPIFMGCGSVLAGVLYITYIDFMNNMGHCNFELMPKWMFQTFPPLKYLIYTPSFHSLHHTQFRTNYSLFMPFYDYIYNTMDSSSDELYERSLKGTEETPDIVHLTHMTSLKSTYHLRIGITSISSKPCNDSVWYMWMLWPVAWLSMAEQLNGSGELFAKKYPRLRVRLIDGSGLATAVVLNSIPFGTKQVFLCGSNSKVTRATAIALCQRGVQVILNQEKEYGMLKSRVPESRAIYLKFSNDETPQFPLKKARKDCTYLSNPAMKIPETMQNVHTCENWLPRRVMSAWRIAGILHALEGWEMHECGDDMMNIEKTWSAAIKHGFKLLTKPCSLNSGTDL